jgi:group I intron endonuclease
MTNIKPIATYTNIICIKSIIFKENRGKSGIYMWTNLINNKSYVGSSVLLTSRFSTYFSLAALENKLKKDSSAIHRALLKYNYVNFKLEILEYCNKEILISREQYYIDLLKPEYNILKIAGSNFGFKHSIESKLKISSKVRGINNPFFGKEHTEESRNRIGESLKLYYKRINIENKCWSKSEETKLKISLRSRGVKIDVFDKENKFILNFSTITSAAIYFKISNRTMGRRLDKGYCNKYTYKLSIQ